MVTKEKIVKMFDYKDGHLYRKNGKKAGTLRKNGYWQTGIEGKIYFNHRYLKDYKIYLHQSWKEANLEKHQKDFFDKACCYSEAPRCRFK